MCSGGDLACFDAIELTPAEEQFRNERAGGNYGAGTKELQERNYIANKELERKRKEMFEDALSDYRAGKVDEALQQVPAPPSLPPCLRLFLGFWLNARGSIVCMHFVTQYQLPATPSLLKTLPRCPDRVVQCVGVGSTPAVRRGGYLGTLEEATASQSDLLCAV